MSVEVGAHRLGLTAAVPDDQVATFLQVDGEEEALGEILILCPV